MPDLKTQTIDAPTIELVKDAAIGDARSIKISRVVEETITAGQLKDKIDMANVQITMLTSQLDMWQDKLDDYTNQLQTIEG